MESRSVPVVGARLCREVNVSSHCGAILGGEHAFNDLNVSYSLDTHDIDFVELHPLRDSRSAAVTTCVCSVGSDSHGAASEAIEPHTSSVRAGTCRIPR